MIIEYYANSVKAKGIGKNREVTLYVKEEDGDILQ